MSKAPARGSSAGQKFLLFVLVCVVSYNTYEMIQLKAEVTTLRAQSAHGRERSPEATPVVDQDRFSLFEQARKEVSEAQARLHLKDYSQARLDLQRSVASLEHANAETRAEGEKVLAELRSAAQSLKSKTSDSSNSQPESGGKTGNQRDETTN